MSRIANYCPNCGHRLEWQQQHGRNRPVCPSCQHIVYFDPKVAVVAFILQDDRLLLVQRDIDPGKGKWALPAGFVEYDEAPLDAAIRETLEETGLHIEIDRLLEVFPKRDDGLADIIIAYEGHVVGGTLQAADDAADARWFSADELPELVFYPSITLVGRWRDGLFE